MNTTRKAIFCFDTATVRFAIYPEGLEGPRIVSQIAETALRDLFGARGGGDSLVAAYIQYADAIDAIALQRYWSTPAVTSLLETSDFDLRRSGSEVATC